MPQDEEEEEEAMEEGNCKAQGLSWRSSSCRNSTNESTNQPRWWTSVVDLSSALISKMDQVPASLVGFSLPWHAGARDGQSKGQRGDAEAFAENQQPEELPNQRNEIAKAGLEVEPLGKSADAPLKVAKPPSEIPLAPLKIADATSGIVKTPLGVAEASMKIAEAPSGAAQRALDCKQGEGDDTEDFPKGDSTEEANARSLTPRGAESRRRTKRMPVDVAPAVPKQQDSDAPTRSKKLSAVSQEFLLGQGQGINSSRVHAMEIRRLQRHKQFCAGSLLAEVIRNNPPHALPPPPPPAAGTSSTPKPSGVPFGNDARVLGGSSRVTRSCEALEIAHLRNAPSASLPSSPRFSVSKESRALKLLRTLGIGTTVHSPHHEFSCRLKPETTNEVMGVRNQGGNEALVGYGSRKKKTSGSTRWLFKWRWGSKATTTLATPKPPLQPSQAVANRISPSSALPSTNMSIGDTFYDASDQYGGDRFAKSEAKSLRHRRSSSWGCASHASTAVITPVCNSRRHRVYQDDDNATENTMNCDISQKVEPYQNCNGNFRAHDNASSASSCRGSFRSAVGAQPSETFEDCHGSFRGVRSFGSSASFGSIGGPSADEETDWDDHRQADHTLTIGDVAALCNSSLKFVFKCREIQHFNKFLRSQKKRLLSAGSNTDSFDVILSGTDTEASSMVGAMLYAWFLDNSVPKVAGKTWHAVPMIDIPRHQMHKHKDAAWIFDACGIDPAALLFADEMELASMVGSGRIKVSTIGQDALVTRNEVGSVCTLLGEKLIAEAQCLMEPRYMKTLLLAGVLLDTENLDFASTRDTEITTALLVGSGSLGRNGFFDQLRAVQDDEQVSKFITRTYGDGKLLSFSRKIPPPPSASSSSSSSAAAHSKTLQQEAEHEQHSDKDSLFTQSQDHTSTSEAGTSSSLEDDSPRVVKERSDAFKHAAQLVSSHDRSAPAKSRQLQPPPSSGGASSCGTSTRDGTPSHLTCSEMGLEMGAVSPSELFSFGLKVLAMGTLTYTYMLKNGIGHRVQRRRKGFRMYTETSSPVCEFKACVLWNKSL